MDAMPGKALWGFLRPLVQLVTNLLNPKVGAEWEIAKKVFKAYFDPNFEKWGIVFSGTAPETELASDELVRNGKFADSLGNTATELEKRRLLGGQFLAFCRNHSDKLSGEGYGNFFVLTKGDEPVKEDLSNVFVADVRFVGAGQLGANVFQFSYDRVWYGASRPRIFSPQR